MKGNGRLLPGGKTERWEHRKRNMERHHTIAQRKAKPAANAQAAGGVSKAVLKQR